MAVLLYMKLQLVRFSASGDIYVCCVCSLQQCRMAKPELVSKNWDFVTWCRCWYTVFMMSKELTNCYYVQLTQRSSLWRYGMKWEIAETRNVVQIFLVTYSIINSRLAGRFRVRISGAHALRLIFRAGKDGSTVSSIICDRWLILS